LEDARAIIARAADITARARALGQPLSGPLRMGIIPTIAPYLLPEILPRLQQQFPALELQLTEDLSNRITDQLRAGSLDLILLAFPYDTPGMTQIPLFAEPFYLACPKGTWKGRVPVTMEDLQDHELLLLEEGHCLRDHALAACRFQAKAGRETFNATSLPTLIQFVQHGYGMTLLPEMAVQPGTAPESLDILPFRAPPPVRQIGMAWRKNHPQEQEFSMLAEAIKSAL
ncbi:MAG: hydrogen peroxide-inducible genes activator, partial [Moorella sp. (in: Bacteria)]|nr:hydrogen peroxide-inducible genes activator [Moorella sp. (in: firmicutes)]